MRSEVLRRLAALVEGPRESPTLTRYTMYRELAELLRSAPPASRLLAISGSTTLAGLVPGEQRIVETEHDWADMLRLPFRDCAFDMVLSDQVLEHVEGDPFVAVSESLRVVRPGGWIVHTSCMMNPVHPSPGDFWRFTAAGLELLVGDAAVVASGSWGSFGALAMIRVGLRRLHVPPRDRHPLHRLATSNRWSWPIVCWVIAEKPADSTAGSAQPLRAPRQSR